MTEFVTKVSIPRNDFYCRCSGLLLNLSIKALDDMKLWSDVIINAKSSHGVPADHFHVSTNVKIKVTLLEIFMKPQAYHVLSHYLLDEDKFKII